MKTRKSSKLWHCIFNIASYKSCLSKINNDLSGLNIYNIGYEATTDLEHTVKYTVYKYLQSLWNIKQHE